ncbi:hypothetical protein WJM97_17360 [Okeanomitos corallinicola TIOX110]|uniref:Uncharacterized protein n=1 Tax=Okeanomitos corallinicola TIOX110 TaxID=3133117 RepID=A0ABZ2URS8_9CYAN
MAIAHLGFSEVDIAIPGKDGDDVPPYLEKQLAKLLTELEELGEEQN